VLLGAQLELLLPLLLNTNLRFLLRRGQLLQWLPLSLR